MNKQTSRKISYLSFIMAFSIILHHTYNVNVYGLKGVLCFFENLILNICESSVSIFFMISAFLFYYNCDSNNIASKLKKRISTLIIPYLIWNCIGYIYYQILNLFPLIRRYYGGEIEPFSIIGLIKSIFNGNYNQVSWFLFALIVYTYVLSPLYKLINTKMGSSCLFVISLVLGTVYGERSNVCAYLSYYSLGVFIATNYRSTFMKRYSNRTIFISFVLYILLMFTYTLCTIDDRSLIRIVIFSLSSIFAWIFTDKLSQLNEPKEWMRFTFVMYLSHEMILEPIEKIFFLIFGNNTFGALVDYILAPIFTTIVIIFFCNETKKIPFIWNLISGNR